LKNHYLSGRTVLELKRGERTFTLVAPDVKDLSESVRALDYDRLFALDLLNFLNREGALVVTINGKNYALSDDWNQHVSDLIEEVERQREKMGHKQ
jgi:hypothetical protein